MKREIAVSILFGVFGLAACGGGSSAPQSSETPDPVSPVSSAPANSAPLISGLAPSGKENELYQFAPAISDPDGDPVSVTVSNLPDWLSYDPVTGALTGLPDENTLGRHTGIVITASDGIAETRVEFDIEVAYDELEQALRTGDSSFVTGEHDILNGLLDTIETDRNKFAQAKSFLFALNEDGTSNTSSLTDVSWDPTQDAALLKSRFGSNEAILTSNSVTNRSYVVQERALAVIGESEHTRYAVFGSNPMRNAYRSDTSVSDDMHQLVRKTMDWLASREMASVEPLNVVLAQFDQSFYFPDQIAVREWLDQTYDDQVSYNDAQSCNGASLQNCISDSTDVLLISQRLYDGQSASEIANQVRLAMQAGVAVMYLHQDGSIGELAAQLFPLFNVDYHGDNYWRKLSIERFDASAVTNDLPVSVVDTRDLIDRLMNQTFTSRLALCEGKSCPDDHPYDDEFLRPVESVQGQLWALDEQGIRLFETRDYRYQKLLVLLGDYYRQRVRFPMDRDITPTIKFLRSLYADHTTYNSRDFNRAQPDMGNFSRSEFSHVTPTTRRITPVSKSGFRATGAYALPGVTFTVTRHDANDVDTHIFINTLRTGATHQFDLNGYSRPKYLESPRYRLNQGETLTLTSAHGGPIQIEYSQNDVPVDIRFEQIGEHPFWSSNADDTRFTTALASGDFDWAELVTPRFEVHSTLEKMRATVTNPMWGTVSQVAAATIQYTQNYPHVLAGLKGPGIDVVPEIHDFATAHGLNIATEDQVKHMNADQATCGLGCSGNPYDAYWHFDPLGHGDLHELGHGLERSRFRFDGWDAHASTDPYSYYSKYRYYTNTGDSTVLSGCQELPFRDLFDAAQASAKADDPIAFMQSMRLNGWAEGSAIYLQLMMRVQADLALESGWNLLPRLHIIEREFSLADDSDEDWLAKRDALGFAGISRTDARRLSNNDWLLIALSHATGRDLRAYLTMWGLDHSAFAASHVKARNLPELPVAVHILDPNAYCLSLDHPAVPVDGNQVWTARD